MRIMMSTRRKAQEERPRSWPSVAWMDPRFGGKALFKCYTCGGPHMARARPSNHRRNDNNENAREGGGTDATEQEA